MFNPTHWVCRQHDRHGADAAGFSASAKLRQVSKVTHTHTHCGVFTDFSPRSQKTRRDAAVLVYHLLLLFLAKSSQRNLEFMQLLESMLCFLQAIGINLFCGDAFSSLKAVSLLERSTIVAKRCQVKFLQPSTINDHSPYLFLHRFYGVSTTRATLTRH